MLPRTKKILTIISFALLLFFAFFSLCLAQKELEVKYPEILGEKPTTVEYGLPSYIKYVFTFAIAIAGIVALSVLIWGGFIYLTSAGNVSKMKESKERITAATLGIVILLSSYIILSTINPQLVIFEIPPLNQIFSPEIKPPLEISPEEASYIVSELPLAQAVKEGIWEKNRTDTLEKVILNFESFLKQETKVNDPELTNDVFNKISDLNKYLKTATDECRCENLRSFCAKPQTDCLPVGCSGDPCQTDQDIDVEPESPRGKMNTVLDIDREKIKTLLNYQEKINEQRDLLREELRKFQEIEGEIIACQNQNKELILLKDYLSNKQLLEENGIKTIKISSYYVSRGNSLTLYCSAGGTAYDSPYTPITKEELMSLATPTEFRDLGCPVRYNTGETFDKLRELAVIQVFKLDHISSLTEEMTKKIQEMTELVSQCNENECNISCACIPNPCYQCCSPIPCASCMLFCQSRCLQCIGGCHGDACPVEEITKKSEEIKEIESKIFEEIEEAKAVFPEVLSELNKLDNLSQVVSSCQAQSGWNILSCKSILELNTIIKIYGENGAIITDCHPKDLYCCTMPDITPSSTDNPPAYIVPAKEFTPLPAENNCPKAWLCNYEVRYYNQYNDASEPLKQLLSCMRAGLNIIQQQDELDYTIGLIAAISDPNIYRKTCSWDAGPTEPGGCSFPYEAKKGKERISSHYGGANCNYAHESYAVKLDVTGDQKKYIDDIIEIAKKCSPAAYILDKNPYLHIDIGEAYGCKSNDY